MIVDSSALIAVLRGEDDAPQHLSALGSSWSTRISAATLVEVGIVADSAGDPVVSRELDALLSDHGVVIEPLTAEHARIAREAHRDFGRRSGHPARLNMGDCFSYALAKATGEPLLYKGEDFVHTDVRSVLPR